MLNTTVELRNTSEVVSPVHGEDYINQGEDSHYGNKNRDDLEMQNTNGNNNGGDQTLLQMIVEDSEMFQFLAYMAILLKPSSKSWKFWYYSARVILGYGALVGLFELIIEGTGSSIGNRASPVTTTVYTSLFLQNLIMAPILFYTYNALTAIRKPRDAQIYTTAFKYALYRGKMVFLSLTILSFLFLILISLTLDHPSVSSVIFTLSFILSTTILSNFFLAGLVAILLIEQRISFSIMNELKEGIKRRDLNDDDYLATREEMMQRDSFLPINWFLSSTTVNTGLLIIILFVISDQSATVMEGIDVVFFCLAYFGRQIIILLWYLYEISLVNEIYEEMMTDLSKCNWKDLEGKRWSLYIALKECPIGSTIFFFRPSRNEIFAQILSVSFAVGLAIFWAIVFA